MGLSRKSVNIATQTNPTKGNFTVHYFTMSVAANENKLKYISFPYDINIVRAKYVDKSDLEGDFLNVDVNPNQPIGLVLANEAIGSTSIQVDATVIRYLDIGYEVNIATPTSYISLGRCIGKTPNSIQFENSLTSEIIAGSYILMTVPLVRDLQFSGANINADVEGTIKTNFLPKGIPILFRYQNNSDQPKKFIFDLEVLY
tara:strand:- start:76 stop:678 length:603 start_codon:yes stop_codon:yes gene_type:complete